jgi:hypothetical protein
MPCAEGFRQATARNHPVKIRFPRNPRLRRAALIGLAALTVLGLALNVLAYRHARAMLNFTADAVRSGAPETLGFTEKAGVLLNGVRIPRPRTTLSPTDIGPGCTALTIESSPGIRLGAWHGTGAPKRPMVLLFHGYAGEKGGMQREARAFLEMGLSVLLVDFRGSGESTGSQTTVGFDEAEDVARSLAFARTNWPGHRMILYGQSMGGAAILRAIHVHGARPDGIVIEAVFNRLLDTVRHRFDAMGIPSFPSAELLVFWGGQQAGFDAFSHNPVDYAPSAECPTLFLHGTDDPRARVDEARQVFDAIAGPKHFQSFPQLGHEPVVRHHPEDWLRAITPFLRTVE